MAFIEDSVAFQSISSNVASDHWLGMLGSRRRDFSIRCCLCRGAVAAVVTYSGKFLVMSHPLWRSPAFVPGTHLGKRPTVPGGQW